MGGRPDPEPAPRRSVRSLDTGQYVLSSLQDVTPHDTPGRRPFCRPSESHIARTVIHCKAAGGCPYYRLSYTERSRRETRPDGASHSTTAKTVASRLRVDAYVERGTDSSQQPMRHRNPGQRGTRRVPAALVLYVAVGSGPPHCCRRSDRTAAAGCHHSGVRRRSAPVGISDRVRRFVRTPLERRERGVGRDAGRVRDDPRAGADT